jgi:pimeloyl-ACP methyl ester carboxylesterase
MGTSLPAELRDTTPVQPETRYAKSGNVNIAYQVVGDGPSDLVAVGVISHIELGWEIPSQARFLTRLASICRFFRVNQRGTGMSDRDVGVATLGRRAWTGPTSDRRFLVETLVECSAST